MRADSFSLSCPAFQSTLPRRERRRRSAAMCRRSNFNPRSREGSDWRDQADTPANQISIHAPAKGAMRRVAQVAHDLRISIHAPAKGATLAIRWPIAELKFQSTLPRRERPTALSSCQPVRIFQSTLPRRERRICSSRPAASPHFNPRSREGSDLVSVSFHMGVIVFQSTLPRRERLG